VEEKEYNIEKNDQYRRINKLGEKIVTRTFAYMHLMPDTRHS